MTKKRLLLVTVFTFTVPVSVIAQSKAIVTSANAVLRSQSSKSGRVRFKVKKNAQLKINTEKDKKGWRYVTVKNKQGWIDTDRIRILIDESQRKSAWLMIGKSAKTNGFSVRYYLNLTQIVRNDNKVNFWTKMIPTNNTAYLNFLMSRSPKKKPVNFNYNVDLWEGNCSTKKVQIVKSLLYWKNGLVENRKISKSQIKAGGNSAAKSVLFEACKIGKRL